MANRIAELIWLLAAALFTVEANGSETVSPHGRTVVSDQVDGHEVAVEFVTHEVNLGQPNAQRRSPLVPACTNSRFPCVVLDSLHIAVDGHQLAIPRSVSATLPDLRAATLRKSGQNFVLILVGADASEGYKVVVEFDKSGIKSRRLYGSFDPDILLEETLYHHDAAADDSREAE